MRAAKDPGKDHRNDSNEGSDNMMIKARYKDNPDTGIYTEITGEIQSGLCQITDDIIKALVNGADMIQITRMSFKELIETKQAEKEASKGKQKPRQARTSSRQTRTGSRKK